MAIPAPNLEESNSKSGKSTTPVIPFNWSDSAESTFNAFLYQLSEQKDFAGLAPEGVRTLQVDAWTVGHGKKKASGSFLPQNPLFCLKWTPTGVLGGYVLSGKVYGPEEFDCLIEDEFLLYYLTEAKSPFHHDQIVEQIAGKPFTSPLAMVGNFPITPGSSGIDDVLDRVRTAVAEGRARAQGEAAAILTGAGVGAVDAAIKALLSVHRSGNVDDAIDILTLLGSNVVRALAEDCLRAFPPDGTNNDYWYALIRAAGRTGDQALPRRFLRSQFIDLEEAALEALRDLGDSEALNELTRVASDHTRSRIIRELAKELASDLA